MKIARLAAILEIGILASIFASCPGCGRNEKPDGRDRPRTAGEAKTKAQWNVMHGNVIGARGSRAALIRSFGKPTRTRTIDNDEYWFYDFRDGFITLDVGNPSHGDNDLVVFHVSESSK